MGLPTIEKISTYLQLRKWSIRASVVVWPILRLRRVLAQQQKNYFKTCWLFWKYAYQFRKYYSHPRTLSLLESSTIILQPSNIWLQKFAVRGSCRWFVLRPPPTSLERISACMHLYSGHTPYFESTTETAIATKHFEIIEQKPLPKIYNFVEILAIIIFTNCPHQSTPEKKYFNLQKNWNFIWLIDNHS